MRVSTSCLGWIPDEPDDRDFDAVSLSLSSPPTANDDREYVAEIWDQDPLQSCVAQGILGAVRARQWYESGGPALAEAPEASSRFFLWWHSRNQHGDARVNSGTYIRTGFKVANDLGLPPEHLWPHVTSDAYVEPPARPTYTKKPPPSTLSHGHDNRRILYHRVYEEGEARIPRIQQLSADHRFPVFGTDVGTSFLDGSGDTYNVKPPLHEKIEGGHCMFIVAYDAHGAWVVNSWSRRWRLNGLIHLSWEYLAWNRTRDIYGVSLAAA